jgi:membrane protease YdiL (CAAX protease family)
MLLPIALCLAAVAIAVMLGAPSPLAAAQARWVEAVDAFLIALLFVALGEEPGWRGWLQPRLQLRLHPLTAALALAPVWALWHLPLMGRQLPPDQIIPFLLNVIAASVVLAWLTNRARGGVLPAMLCHGMINAIGANYLYRLFEGDAVTIIWWTASALWFVAGVVAAFALQREYRASQGDVSIAAATA